MILHIVHAAYVTAAAEQPPEYPKLPEWEKLPIEIREAFIHVYFAGRADRMEARPIPSAKTPEQKQRLDVAGRGAEGQRALLDVATTMLGGSKVK
jgi:hypothetical protein